MPPSSLEPTADLEACKAILARGSKSFALASLLLPRRVRDPAAALYAFCRVADDAIDGAPRGAGLAALDDLRGRLDRVASGSPDDDPVDRALARVMAQHHLPRAPLDALLEGFEWDLEGRRYETIESLFAYAARVAGTVGVAMTFLMDRRDPRVLARACDLGVAMQLSNIARDVGEDARNGRVYLPEAWLRAVGLSADAILARPEPSPALSSVVARLVSEAEVLYRRADAGVPALPRDCRPAIRAARLVYSDLHRVIARRGFDTVSSRAFVSKPRKLWLVGRAFAAWLPFSLREDVGAWPALDEVRFLIGEGTP